MNKTDAQGKGISMSDLVERKTLEETLINAVTPRLCFRPPASRQEADIVLGTKRGLTALSLVVSKFSCFSMASMSTTLLERKPS